MTSPTRQIFLLKPFGDRPPPGGQTNDTMESNLSDVNDFTKVCRICATVTNFVVPIYNLDGALNEMARKINLYLPIQVRESDELPLVLCCQCVNTVLAWDDLVQTCTRADTALRARLAAVRAAPAPRLVHGCPRILPLPRRRAEVPSTSTNEAGQNQRDMSESFHTRLKDILNDNFPTMRVIDGTLDVELVCQKCDSRPTANTIEQLAEHLDSVHSCINDHLEVKMFVENFITFEETLSSDDSDRDAESLPMTKENEVLPNFFCPFCESVFSSAARLMSHLSQHIDIPIEQGVVCCDQTFSDKKLFMNHLQSDHVSRKAEESQTMNNCRTCGYEAENLEDLEDHVVQTHKEKDTTETLSKRKEPSLKNQKFIPAVCPECNKVFSNKYNMFVHMKSHSQASEKYACDKCNKSYSNRGNLNNHRKLAHKGELKFICSSCGEAFPTKLACSVHARLHSGDTPYSCDLCSKAFRAKNTLDRHMDMHLDIRKHLCHLCPKKFRKRTHLTYHLSTHKDT